MTRATAALSSADTPRISDILVIGGGLAGSSFAIACASAGIDVVLVDRLAPVARTAEPFDGKTYATFDHKPGDTEAEWPFNKPFYLILNLAIGGSWGGQKGIAEAEFPQRMEVDYVRVYQKSVDGK